MHLRHSFSLAFIVATWLCCPAALFSQTIPPDNLEGIWQAKRYFGPWVEGTLEITQTKREWRAHIGAFNVPISVDGDRLSFDLPGNNGQFQGHFSKDRSQIEGFWIQPKTQGSGGTSTSPVAMIRRDKNHWRGEVVTMRDEWTLYLVITRRTDGSLGAFIRDPGRNMGRFWDLDHVEQEGNNVKLIGKLLGRGNEQSFGEGTYHPDKGRLSIYLANTGTYDFERVKDDPVPGFYSRGKGPKPYEYQPPEPEDDGWPVGTIEEAGISQAPLADLIQSLDGPATSRQDLDLHALLIARHGKLVFEDYFHGFDRNRPHDLKSATKSIASTITGAVIQSGAKLSVSTPVYDLIYKGKIPEGTDPRKKEMTVEHLLTMSSGFNCNDWADDERPGSEDNQWQTSRDFYQFALQLPMESKPGTLPAYCSVDANLLGAVVTAATGRPVRDLFQDLVAGPMQMRHYYLGVQPTGEPYLAGNIYLQPRDFLKLAQMMLNGGVWNRKRIVSKEFAQRATSPLIKIPGQYEGMNFGYLWWTVEYKLNGRPVLAFFAGGNGGQTSMAIPELDAAVAITQGNYGDPAGWKMRREFIPKYILPAIQPGNWTYNWKK